MREYSLNKRIDGDEPLVKLFNSVMEETNFLRMVSAPCSTFSFEHTTEHMPKAFYECCLAETYLHRIVDGFREWKEDALRYVNEFNCSWKYYALAEKRDLTEKYGEDENDYDENGNLKTSFTDEELKPYVPSESWTGYNDILLTARPENFEFLHNILNNANVFSFGKMKQALGWNISTYQNVDGEMKPMSWEDEVLSEATDQHRADTISDILRLVFKEVRAIIDEVNELNPTQDNRGFYESFPTRVDRLFGLEININ